ncbi:hypothetical protein V6U77_26580 [Micromonospora sp. CPCC 205546]
MFRFADRAVSVTGDDDFLAAAAGLLAPYVRRTATADGATLVASLEFENTTRSEHGEAVIIKAFQQVRSALLDVVLCDHAPLHGAVVTCDGTGIVLTGPKGAGKTSFVSALLRCSPEWDFVTNDKSVVSPHDGSVLGLPFAVAVGHVGRAMTPELADLPARPSVGKDLFWPADFARAFGSRPAAATPLHGVVLCEADFAASRIEVLTDVDQDERRIVLERDMTDFGDAMIPQRRRTGRTRDAELPPLPAEWSVMPWVRLRGNPWTMSRDTMSAVRTAVDFQRVV